MLNNVFNNVFTLKKSELYVPIQCESIKRKPRFNVKSLKNKNRDHKTNIRE